MLVHLILVHLRLNCPCHRQRILGHLHHGESQRRIRGQCDLGLNLMDLDLMETLDGQERVDVGKQILVHGVDVGVGVVEGRLHGEDGQP